MKRNYKKIWSLHFYINKYKSVRKDMLVWKLWHKKEVYTPFLPLWETRKASDTEISGRFPLNELNIFGISVNKENIDWHKDYVSGFVFEPVRIDKIKAHYFFDKGIDVKFPWELSRCTFLLQLADQYLDSGNEDAYKDFRQLIMHWISSNPFLIGINWKCTMDVAIRAIAWSISGSVFYDFINRDKVFLEKFSSSLIEHAEYILTFPEVYDHNHTTNHTVADYTGLLYLSFCLPGHLHAKKWFDNALRGIIACMEYQVNNEGFCFEASTAYHRLVTELFALSFVVCKANAVELPAGFKAKLANMFRFVEGIIQPDGTVPLLGDNDSGTILQPDFHLNADYTYLLSLGNRIFDFEFQSDLSSQYNPSFLFLPAIKKEKPDLPGHISHFTSLHSFHNSGIYMLANAYYQSCIGTLPLGQKGRGAHNHLDYGSFTLVVGKMTCLVDPGTYMYTRNIKTRNQFKSYYYHNVLIPGDYHETLEVKNPFLTRPYYKSKSLLAGENSLEIEYLLNDPHKVIYRRYAISEESFTVENKYPGDYVLKLHFSPLVKKPKSAEKEVLLFDLFKIDLQHIEEYTIEEYFYSPAYGIQIPSLCLTLKAAAYSSMKFSARL